MSRPAIVPLNSQRHRNVRLCDGIDVSTSLAANHAWLGLDEVQLAVCDYPVAFLKDAQTGQFVLMALFGFDPQQNCFVHGNSWHATFVPRSILLRPLALVGAPLTLALDEASPLVQGQSGKRLFDPAGLETDFLTNIRAGVSTMLETFQAAHRFAKACSAHGLIKPLLLDLTDIQGGSRRIEGLYQISQTALQELAEADVLALHRDGFLQTIYAMIHSLGQINRLQQLSNATDHIGIKHVEMSLIA